MSHKRRTALTMVSAGLLTLSLAGAALAHPHKAGPTNQVIANGQNHPPSSMACRVVVIRRRTASSPPTMARMRARLARPTAAT